MICTPGREPGASDITDPTPTDITEPIPFVGQVLPNVMKETLQNGDVVYVTVQCENNAGFRSSKSSNGVAILTSGPSVQSAALHGLTPSDTVYDTRDNTQPNANTKSVSWDGFYDPLGVVKYEVRHVRLMGYER